LNPQRLRTELQNIVPGGSAREGQLAAYRDVARQMGSAGASATTARLITRYLRTGWADQTP